MWVGGGGFSVVFRCMFNTQTCSTRRVPSTVTLPTRLCVRGEYVSNAFVKKAKCILLYYIYRRAVRSLTDDELHQGCGAPPRPAPRRHHCRAIRGRHVRPTSGKRRSGNGPRVRTFESLGGGVGSVGYGADETDARNTCVARGLSRGTDERVEPAPHSCSVRDDRLRPTREEHDRDGERERERETARDGESARERERCESTTLRPLRPFATDDDQRNPPPPPPPLPTTASRPKDAGSGRTRSSRHPVLSDFFFSSMLPGNRSDG